MGRLAPLKKGIVERKGIFVVGAARSGTTLLRLLINNHPDIACIGETQFFHHNYLQLSSNSEKNISIFSDIFRTESELPNFIYNNELLKYFPKDKTIASYFNVLLSAYAKNLGKNKWAEKSPSHILRIELIKKLFPDAKIINIKRNPYSSAISRFQKLKKKEFNNFSIFFYLKYLKKVDKIASDFERENKDSILTVKYEDLSENPKFVLEKIFSFLDVTDVNIDDEFLSIQSINIPKDKKGLSQTHHKNVSNKIEVKTYNNLYYFSDFQMYLFQNELATTKHYSEYIDQNAIPRYFFLKLILNFAYLIFEIPSLKIRRIVNQFKSTVKRITS